MSFFFFFRDPLLKRLHLTPSKPKPDGVGSIFLFCRSQALLVFLFWLEQVSLPTGAAFFPLNQKGRPPFSLQ